MGFDGGEFAGLGIFQFAREELLNVGFRIWKMEELLNVGFWIWKMEIYGWLPIITEAQFESLARGVYYT